MPTNRPPWDKGPWYESDNPTTVVRGASSRLAVWIVCAVVFVLALSAGIWWYNVATSGIKGKGDVIQQNNSGTNQINSQAYFEQLKAVIDGYTIQLPIQGQVMTANPGDDMARTNYVGLYSSCVQAVTKYNQTSKQTTFKDWKTADLPEQIDPKEACPATPIPGASK